MDYLILMMIVLAYTLFAWMVLADDLVLRIKGLRGVVAGAALVFIMFLAFGPKPS